MPYRPTHPLAIDPAAITDDEPSVSGLVAAVLAVVMWSSGNIMVRSVDMPGVQIAFWRITLSAIVYWLFLRLRGRTITREQFRRSAPAAVSIAIEIAVFFVAIKHTTVANTTIIGALQPVILLAVLSRFGERVTRVLIGIIGLAVAGILLVVIGSSAAATWSPWGDFLAVIALVFFSSYFFYAKKARATVPSFEFQTAVWIIGSVTLLPIAVFDAGGVVPPTAGQWMWLAALLLVPGTGHLLMNWSHPRLKLSLTSILTLLMPILSTIGAALLLDEPVGALQIVGIIVVMAALTLAIRRNARLREFQPG